jgi:hypothetical protein
MERRHAGKLARPRKAQKARMNRLGRFNRAVEEKASGQLLKPGATACRQLILDKLLTNDAKRYLIQASPLL